MPCTLYLWILFTLGLTETFGEDVRNNWAVLVAGSNGWSNYRHQSDICHAYHILRSHGIPEENIITMMYDDIAHNPHNMFPGKIFNDYQHEDVYAGVKIDYRGSQVNPAMFIDVLLGSEELKAAGMKVLDSGPLDNVFIYFSDHGAPNLIAFPDGVLYAQQLVSALKRMIGEGRSNQTVIYVEACFSGSMFDELLPDDIQVYATTAASNSESSYAAFCDDKDLDTCLADEYSYQWMSDSSNHDLSKWTLNDQFRAIKQSVVHSEVSMFGNTEMGALPVGDFQSHTTQVNTNRPYRRKFMQSKDTMPSHQAHLVGIMRKLMRANTEQERMAARRKLDRTLQLGRLVVETFDDIVRTVQDQVERTEPRQPSVHQQLDCYKTIFDAFQIKCFTIQQVPEVARELVKFRNLCQSGYNANQMVHVIHDICG